jgi:hypothetical protein
MHEPLQENRTAFWSSQSSYHGYQRSQMHRSMLALAPGILLPVCDRIAQQSTRVDSMLSNKRTSCRFYQCFGLHRVSVIARLSISWDSAELCSCWRLSFKGAIIDLTDALLRVPSVSCTALQSSIMYFVVLLCVRVKQGIPIRMVAFWN